MQLFMYCYQCQETGLQQGCTIEGMCGKSDEVANLQDLLIYTLKGIGVINEKLKYKNLFDSHAMEFVAECFYMTITNSNFDAQRFISQIRKALDIKKSLYDKAIELGVLNVNEFDSLSVSESSKLKDIITWSENDEKVLKQKSLTVGVLTTEDIDLRSLRETITYGLKGISAYIHHADELGFHEQSVLEFIAKALNAIVTISDFKELIPVVLETGKNIISAMSILDTANASIFGNPEICQTKIDVGNRPGILISGHNLGDLKMLLEQSKDSGVDIYTHSEMISAHYYPELKKYSHLRANYGNAWWKQDIEFEKFNGPIVMTSNCIIPFPADTSPDNYKNRIYTTGIAGYPGVAHIEKISTDFQKDFSQVIEQAKKCKPPEAIDSGTMPGGFNHRVIKSLMPKILEAVRSGKITKFVVMGGCDGRDFKREYYTEFAKKMPATWVILTAGCAKYRYIKLNLGDIDGIPRVLDAGQCNDCFSSIMIASMMKDALGVDSLNDLPVSIDIAWYDQKAVAIFLGLLHLGLKKMIIGPTMPAFLSENVRTFLKEHYDLRIIDSADKDIEFLKQVKHQ